MAARSRILAAMVQRPPHFLNICAVALLISACLSAPAWAVNVPFRIDIGTQIIEGIGKLENGHLTGQTSLGGRPISLVGEMQDGDLTIEVDGAIISPGLALTGSGIGYYCTASAASLDAVGKVAIRMNAQCGTEFRQVTLYLDFPADGTAPLENNATPQPAPAATNPATSSAQSQLANLPSIANLDFGRYEALVVGDDRYQGGLPALKTAAADASAVADVLRSAYGFKVTLLQNATRDQIIGTLAKLRRTLTWDDNLLIYYAGHGSYDEGADQGYWLPVDAALDDPSNWVSNGDITSMLKSIQARHVLVVADSCYSGTLTRGANADTKDAGYIQRMVQKKARTVMTSGGLEPVADMGGNGHSVFASAFIAALQQNKGVMDAETFFAMVRGPVMLAATQTPQYSNLRFAGHEGGDFIFVRKQ